MPAEQVVRDVVAELVVGQSVLASDHPKRLRLDDRAPIPALAADRAVALAGAGGEIDVGLVADRAAMAAAPIGLDAHGWLPWDDRFGWLIATRCRHGQLRSMPAPASSTDSCLRAWNMRVFTVFSGMP